MRPYDLITFDCYGTLIDWEEGMRHALENLASDLDMRIDADKMVARYIQLELGLEQGAYRAYREILQTGLAAVFREKNVSLTEHQSKKFHRALPTWKPFPEVRAVLKKLRNAGYRLAILSNADDAFVRRAAQRIGVKFDRIITAQQIGSYKPAFKHWQKILSATKIPKKRVLHVSSCMIHDVIPASAMGLPCVWINRRRQRQVAIAKPLRVFNDLRPLADMLTES